MENLQIFSNWVISLDWVVISNIFIASATVALAIVAWKGLNQWKDPLSLKAKLQITDELIASITEFHIFMGGIINAIDTFKDLCATYPDGLVGCMKEHEEKLSQPLIEEMKPGRPILSKIRILLTKTLYLGFKDSNKTQTHLNQLIYQYSDLIRLAHFLSYKIEDETNTHTSHTRKK